MDDGTWESGEGDLGLGMSESGQGKMKRPRRRVDGPFGELPRLTTAECCSEGPARSVNSQVSKEKFPLKKKKRHFWGWGLGGWKRRPALSDGVHESA